MKKMYIMKNNHIHYILQNLHTLIKTEKSELDIRSGKWAKQGQFQQ